MIRGRRDSTAAYLPDHFVFGFEALNPRPRHRVGHDLHDEIDRLFREMKQEKESKH